LAGTTSALDARWSVGVLRAREGGLLLGTCRDFRFARGDTFVLPAPVGGLDRLIALLPLDDVGDGRAQRFAVLAPADAATVELAGRSATVHERIAVFDLGTKHALSGLQAKARRADDTITATATRTPTSRDLDAPYIDERPSGS
jgi:hypothetical protein